MTINDDVRENDLLCQGKLVLSFADEQLPRADVFGRLRALELTSSFRGAVEL